MKPSTVRSCPKPAQAVRLPNLGRTHQWSAVLELCESIGTEVLATKMGILNDTISRTTLQDLRYLCQQMTERLDALGYGPDDEPGALPGDRAAQERLAGGER